MKELGIDVSEHQGIINWDLVKDKIKYAIIRLGYIGNTEVYLDKQFNRNYDECKRLGIPVGIYVYNYCKTEERLNTGISWILEQLQGKELNLPIFLDMEDSTIKDLGVDNLTNQCVIFCNAIQKANYKSGIYANLDWFNNMLDVKRIAKYTLWLAQWTKRKNHSADFDVEIWQYGKDEIEGINGVVDVNYMLEDIINIEQIEPVEEIQPNEPEIEIPSNDGTKYTVQKGDTLWRIGQKFGIPWNVIYQNNKDIIGNNPNLIKVGQVLNITLGSNAEITYTVKAGDNLTKIAKQFGTSWNIIYQNNKDVIGNNPNLIRSGQVLKIK